ncbi:MAG TPA: acyltransferase [Clostridium sp.]|uniref:acyltransferase family protein n=1 Tax=Clostridium sp. TaxID=1506 RepID=UPI002F93AEB8
MKNKNRIESLDWLRGLMALSLMLYHLVGLTFFKLNAGSVLGRLGIYGVSIFFILSGLSMAIVYSRYIKDIRTSLYFFIRRIFRIWPLLWVVTLLIIIHPVPFNQQGNSIINIILNLTTTVGLIKPSDYIAVGTWSIGSEMLYYVFTPLIIFLYNKKILFGNLFFLFTVLIGFHYSQILLIPTMNLSYQWQIYINPFNNLYLYITGIAIFYNLKQIKVTKKMNIVLLIVCLICFITLPFKGNQIVLITGMGRAIFSILSICIVISFYKMDFSVPKIIRYQLEILGIATYSIYLLHPVVNVYVGIVLHKYFSLTNPIFQFILAIISTIIISLISYKYLETPFVKLGKKVTFIKH